MGISSSKNAFVLFLAVAAIASFSIVVAGDEKEAGFLGKVEKEKDGIKVSYDFRNTNQHMDFENGVVRITMNLSGSGTKSMGGYHETGRLTFDPEKTLSWKGPAQALSRVKLNLSGTDNVLVQLASKNGSAKIAFGPRSQIVVETPDKKKDKPKQKKSKAIRFDMKPDKSYDLDIKIDDDEIIVRIDRRKAMKVKLPKGIEQLDKLSFTSTQENIVIKTMEITAQPGLPESPEG